jgi:hypothetical protein
MLPLAVGIAVHLIACRAWKSALCWSGMFWAGLTSVALSKLVFLGWGIGVPTFAFQALSGHAFRAAAVIPTLFFVLFKPISTSYARLGVVTGIIISSGIDVLLIFFKFHSFSEVLVSSLIGFGVCLGFIHICRNSTIPKMNYCSASCTILAIFVVFCFSPWSYNNRLLDVARYLSSRGETVSMDRCASSK